MAIFGSVADRDKIRMVTVLLAAFCITAGRLEMGTGIGCNPYFCPGRWNGKPANAFQRRGIAHGLSTRPAIAEAARFSLPLNSSHVIIDVMKANRFGSRRRLLWRYLEQSPSCPVSSPLSRNARTFTWCLRGAAVPLPGAIA